nr:MAG TPA: hypothetical protein [Caudoviricetes sp.]
MSSILGRFRTYFRPDPPLSNPSFEHPFDTKPLQSRACRTPRTPSPGCTYISPSVSARASSTCAYKLIYIGPSSQLGLEPCRH